MSCFNLDCHVAGKCVAAPNSGCRASIVIESPKGEAGGVLTPVAGQVLHELARVCFEAGIAHGQGAKNDWSTDGKALEIIDRLTRPTPAAAADLPTDDTEKLCWSLRQFVSLHPAGDECRLRFDVGQQSFWIGMESLPEEEAAHFAGMFVLALAGAFRLVAASPAAAADLHPPHVTKGMVAHLAASVEELDAVGQQLQDIESKYGLAGVPIDNRGVIQAVRQSLAALDKWRMRAPCHGTPCEYTDLIYEASSYLQAALKRAASPVAPAGPTLREDAFYDMGYQRGVASGWNLCVAQDHEGFARANQSTEHIKVLRVSPVAPAGAPTEEPTNEELERLWETTHYGHPADFAADVLQRWGGWPSGMLGYGGALQEALRVLEKRRALLSAGSQGEQHDSSHEAAPQSSVPSASSRSSLPNRSVLPRE